MALWQSLHALVRSDRRGSIAVLSAVSLMAVLGVATLAIDGGIVRVQTERLQAGADAAALAVTWSPANGATVAAASLASNGLTGITPGVFTGMYCPDPTLAAAARFTAGASSCATVPGAGTTANAAQVQLARTVPLVLGLFSATNSVQVQASATAVRMDVAGLAIGTSALQMDAGGTNALLGGLLGTVLGGNTAGYAAMLGAQVDVLDLLNAFATQAGLSGGTYGSLSAASITMAQVGAALGAALGGEGATGSTAAAAATLATIGPQLGNAPIRIGALIDVGPWANDQVGGAPPTALHGSLNVFLVLSDSAQLNGGALFSVSTLPMTLPLGIASASITAAAIAPPALPFFGFGPVGETVRSSQIRLAVSLALSTPLFNLYHVTLPLYVQVASGAAQISAIACGAAPAVDATVSLLTQSGLADAYVGQVLPADLTSFAQTPSVAAATLVNVSNALTVKGFSHTSVASSGQQTLLFTQPMIGSHQFQSIASGSLPSSVGMSLGGSNLSLTVKVLGAGLTTGAVQSAMVALLSPVLSTALDPMVASLLGAFGIRLGIVDTTVDGVRCGVPALVQ